MNIEEVIKYIEDWAPKGIAWEKDNIGLQVGNPKNEVSNILLALDFNEKVLREAIKKKSNLIITHHPYIFTPIKNLNFNTDTKSKLIKELIQNNTTLYSAHTNLDYTKGGVSFELAKRIELENIQFLENQLSNQYKLAVYIPEENVDLVSDAIFNAGGGIIGEYSKCSSKNFVEGTFEGSSLSNPTIGKSKSFERVSEIKLEVLVNSWKLNSIIDAMKSVHPYEEPAYDIFVLKNKNNNYGAGAIGQLPKSMTSKEFLSHVKKSLKTNGLKYAIGSNSKIKKVAVCGGTCSDLMNKAIAAQADAFITADIKYHTFLDAENIIMLIDAGHYETEVPVLKPLKIKLDKFIKSNNSPVKVFKYNGSNNPVKFFN
ncbi:MAG: Nif3-like dinuclear metal center hexameric protein [Melioribacteraceae bacterium]|jgi:dinuclear metal center YbgI/SA1388 family protein|nr:Nif3-like dinuclear metal center hexameric protein [Melioribacteraceae bacterium]